MPQQSARPSAVNPHVWLPPAVSWVYGPVWSVACPEALLPQQSALPSGFNPQVWLPPALRISAAIGVGAAEAASPGMIATNESVSATVALTPANRRHQPRRVPVFDT